MASPPDPYLILGVSPTASDEDLRTAYRRLVQRHHPDHNNGSRESALRFAEVQEAYAHVQLLRKRAAAATAAPPPNAAGDPSLESRLAALENELRAAREQRRKAAREAAREAARAASREQKRRPAGGDDHATDEELGYYTTDDSFTKILDDFADEVSSRFAEAHRPPDPSAGSKPRRPRSVADWIDELGSRLTGDSGPKKKE